MTEKLAQNPDIKNSFEIEKFFVEYSNLELRELLLYLEDIRGIFTNESFWQISLENWREITQSLRKLKSDIQLYNQNKGFSLVDDRDIISFQNNLDSIDKVLTEIIDETIRIENIEIGKLAKQLADEITGLNELVKQSDEDPVYICIHTWLTEEKDGHLIPDPLAQLGLDALTDLVSKLGNRTVKILISGGHASYYGENLADIYSKYLAKKLTETEARNITIMVQSVDDGKIQDTATPGTIQRILDNSMASSSGGEVEYFASILGEMTKGVVLVFSTEQQIDRAQALARAFGPLHDAAHVSFEALSINKEIRTNTSITETDTSATKTDTDIFYEACKLYLSNPEIHQQLTSSKRVAGSLIEKLLTVIVKTVDRKGKFLDLLAKLTGAIKQHAAEVTHGN